MSTLKKKLAFITVVILLVVFVGFISLVASQSKDNTPSLQQTAESTIFAPTKNPPVVKLIYAQANSKTLIVTLAISGLELVKNSDDFENIICDPYIRTDKSVQLTLNYRESEIPSRVGEPIVITYEYGMDAKEYQGLNVDMDLTIGPCGPYFVESNVTPYPVELIANYRLSFTVPIE